jgi:3-isopropylmalate/(R)-2-methylmalate dehydratase small subunit
LVAPLYRRDIDTDQIIPKAFLKSIERTGFGAHLFHDWRVRADGSPVEEFVLNQPRYARASILVAGPNFGCGSSREHAAWALADFGFRVVVSSSFADIFRANAVSNGIVTAAVREEVAAALAASATQIAGYTVEVDLSARRLRDHRAIDEPFEIDDAARHRLLLGLDDIGMLLEHEPDIAAYERATMPRPPRF